MKTKKVISLIAVLSMLLASVAILAFGDDTEQTFAKGTINDDVCVTEDFDYSFLASSLSEIKSMSSLAFQMGNNFQSNGNGLYVPQSVWDSVGVDYSTDGNKYAFSSFMRHGSTNSTSATQAVMLGIRCRGAYHLFIDSGIWALCRNNSVSFYCDGVSMNATLSSLPVSFASGASLIVEDEGGNGDINYYVSSPNVEKTFIGSISVNGSSLTVKDENGDVVSNYSQADSIADGGYCRVMSHYIEGYITSMSLSVSHFSSFYENKPVIAMMKGKKYCFADLVKYDLNDAQNAECFEFTGGYYLPASVLADAVGMEYSEDAIGILFTYGSNTVRYLFGEDKAVLFGEEVSSNQPVRYKDEYFICADEFASFIGYSVLKDVDGGIMVMYSPKSDASSSIQLYKERFALYDSVVFNYSDVACDQTGVGKYTQCPQEDRLVGVAYTTWRTANSSWGEGSTWDMPLLGPYVSNDRDVIRQHAIWLADAGVDFIVIDWSNNVGYDPETYYREDFAMIEDATYAVFEVFATVENAPKICIMTGPGHIGSGAFTDGNMDRKNNQIYNEFIASTYNDMYFYYEGKPLLLCYAATPTIISGNTPPYTDSRFTERWVTGFVGQQSSLFSSKTYRSYLHWSWEERVKQTYTLHNNVAECMTVVASYRGQGTVGQSGYIAPGGRNNGQTFLTQWQRANDIGVKISLVVSFNEWTSGEQTSLEVSKDIEPCVTFGTFYLDILKEQIKKFKGQVDTSSDSGDGFVTGISNTNAPIYRNVNAQHVMVTPQSDEITLGGWFASDNTVSGFACSVNGGAKKTISGYTDNAIPECMLAYASGCNGINSYSATLKSADLLSGANNVKVYAVISGKYTLCADITLICSSDAYITANDENITVQRTNNATYVRVPCGYTIEQILSALDGDCTVEGEAATGGRIILTVDSFVCEKAYIIVNDDINGDGKVNAKDCISAKKLRYNGNASELGFVACDVDLDGYISDEEIASLTSSVIG